MQTLVLEDRPMAELIEAPHLIGAAHHDEDDFLVAQAIGSHYVEDDDLVLWWATLLDS